MSPEATTFPIETFEFVPILMSAAIPVVVKGFFSIPEVDVFEDDAAVFGVNDDEAALVVVTGDLFD